MEKPNILVYWLNLIHPMIPPLFLTIYLIHLRATLPKRRAMEVTFWKQRFDKLLES